MGKNILILSLLVFLLTTCSKDKTPDRLLARFGQDYHLLMGTWKLKGSNIKDYDSRKYYPNNKDITITFDNEANITINNNFENIHITHSTINLIKDVRIGEYNYLKILKLDNSNYIFLNLNLLIDGTQLNTNIDCVTSNTYQFCNEIINYIDHEFFK